MANMLPVIHSLNPVNSVSYFLLTLFPQTTPVPQITVCLTVWQSMDCMVGFQFYFNTWNPSEITLSSTVFMPANSPYPGLPSKAPCEPLWALFVLEDIIDQSQH